MHEECGVFGVYCTDDRQVAEAVYSGLYALQHRGQESCGIAVNDEGTVRVHKDMGLVGDVFSREHFDKLPGRIGIGHVRYSTTGQSVRENAQPLVSRYQKGQMALAHNGNLSNTETLRQALESEGAIFSTTIDSEIIAYLIARSRTRANHMEDAVSEALSKVKGAYSLLVMSRGKLIAVRDPFGFRPLCIGRFENGYVVASESCALDAVGAVFIRDVQPGEMITLDRQGLTSFQFSQADVPRPCIFEFIYFARSDSQIDGVSVHQARLKAGHLLAQQHPASADLVIGVPESGIDAAIGYSQASGIPYGKGFVKNTYIGRTFIQPTQIQRESSLRLKLNPIRGVIKGKRLVMIDDSIVRGTTSARIIRLLKDAGASEVHVRISAPPFMWPCYFGTDIPTQEHLIARQMSLEAICSEIGADSLGFLDQESLGSIIGMPGQHRCCDACFSGDYPHGSLENMD